MRLSVAWPHSIRLLLTLPNSRTPSCRKSRMWRKQSPTCIATKSASKAQVLTKMRYSRVSICVAQNPALGPGNLRKALFRTALPFKKLAQFLRIPSLVNTAVFPYKSWLIAIQRSEKKTYAQSDYWFTCNGGPRLFGRGGGRTNSAKHHHRYPNGTKS